MNGEDLLSANGLRGLCDLEEQYFRPYFNCPLLSISKAVTEMIKKPCSQISDEDTTSIRNLLTKCAPFYRGAMLKELGKSKNKKLNNVPLECGPENGYSFVYTVFYYLASINYLHPQESNHTYMQYTIAYMTFGKSIEISWKEFYQLHLESKEISNKYVKLVAVDLPYQEEIKFELFSAYLYSDMKLFVLAAWLIIMIMLIYLKSIALIFATVFNVVSSFILAYFLYRVVFQIAFFPFLNVLAVLVLIAVGADDVFIFCDTWEQIRQTAGTDISLEVAMAHTFRHAALTIFVTSLTTAAAFFANTVSRITVIRCFGIFAGLSMLCNFFFMLVLTPSILIISIKAWNVVTKHCKLRGEVCFRIYRWLSGTFSKLNSRLFSCVFPYLIEKLWPLWMTIFIGLGIGSCFVIFVSPKLHLPATQNFQLLQSNNILEKWDSTFQDRFQSTVDKKKESSNENMTVYFVWGFQPNFEGFTLNPDVSETHLTEDSEFNFYKPESQIWFKKFCEHLKEAPFVHNHGMASCIVDHFVKLAETYCVPPLSKIVPHCCSKTTLPFAREQLEVCSALMLANYSFPKVTQWLRYGEIGNLVYGKNNEIKGIVVRIPTNLKFSMSYSVMDSNYNVTDTFMKKILSDAPAGMNRAYFAVLPPRSFAQLYDLQREIASGTFYSIGISLGIALLVMFLATRNLLVTVYAVVNIGFVIFCTLALIVLLGWDLNILESVTVSLGIGLSIDFTIHYGVAYVISEHADSKSRVQEGFVRVGGAVAMSALTTFAAGAAMLPSHVLAYYKLGSFLMIIMSFSWSYSTFLFQSLCRIVGPRGNFCQVPSCGQTVASRETVSEVSSVMVSEDGPPVFNSTYSNIVLDQTTVSTSDFYNFSSVAV